MENFHIYTIIRTLYDYSGPKINLTHIFSNHFKDLSCNNMILKLSVGKNLVKISHIVYCSSQQALSIASKIFSIRNIFKQFLKIIWGLKLALKSNQIEAELSEWYQHLVLEMGRHANLCFTLIHCPLGGESQNQNRHSKETQLRWPCCLRK